MWDARETQSDAQSAICIRDAVPALCFAPLDTNLLHQANSAVRGHAEAAQDLTAAEQRAIVDFESSLFAAQSQSGAAGDLAANGARGGPAALAKPELLLRDQRSDQRRLPHQRPLQPRGHEPVRRLAQSAGCPAPPRTRRAVRSRAAKTCSIRGP
ncbi:hypothetical protein LP419_08920 [Massilia sp. H-1]|nr:hypothetical protein LP419_08920 [Massilia sp. H-1]